jgi:hypothetical protein
MGTRFWAAAFGAALAAGSSANPSPQDIARITEEGKNRNQVMKTLGHMTQRIGPRLTGSPTLDRANRWAATQFRSYGLQNIHLHKWGEIPVGFERGKRQRGEMVSPTRRTFEFTTMNWMPGTEGKVRAGVAVSPSSVDEINADPAKFKGKWILMSEAASMRGASASNAQVKEALDNLGIAGRVFGARDERIHSSGNWREKSYDKRPKDVNIIIRKSDADAVRAALAANQNPQLEFDIENRWIKGPIPQYNLVAEIPGTDLAHEVVIICAHHDSWNSPGSQGTCDNGTGAAVALEAARILQAAKVKPRRTIRFILWGGEEQGLLGSRAYVEQYRDQMKNVVAVLNDDGGTGYQAGYEGIAGMKEIMETAFAPTVAAFPSLPMKFNVRETMPQGGSSDHAPFIWAGVPAFFTIEGGNADYGKVWHTQFDRFEEAKPEYLVQSSTNHALVAYHLATIDGRLPTFTPPTRRVGRLDHALAIGADRIYDIPDWDDIAEHLKGGVHDHEDDYVLELIDRLRRMGAGLVR